jgi:hypothetical protein
MFLSLAKMPWQHQKQRSVSLSPFRAPRFHCAPYSFDPFLFVAMQFADGYLDAAIIKDCPRWDVLGLVLQMKDGAYVNSPCVEYFKVRCFFSP